MNYRYIVAVGDSLTFPARDEYRRGYPLELSRILTKHFNSPVIVVNAGINREISADIARRFHREVRSVDCSIVLLICGTNDAKPWQKTPPEIYKDNLLYMLDIAKTEKKLLLLGQIPYLKADFYYGDYDKDTDERIQQYNEVVRELQPNAPDFYTLFKNNANLAPDGVHPSNEGNKAIAKLWFDTLVNKVMK